VASKAKAVTTQQNLLLKQHQRLFNLLKLIQMMRTMLLSQLHQWQLQKLNLRVNVPRTFSQ
jgi:hypothetical protein